MASVNFLKSTRKSLMWNNLVVVYSKKPVNISRWNRKTEIRSLCTTAKPKEFEYTCTEVGVPVPGGTLAGKLWEPKTAQTQGTTGTEEIPPILCLHGWLDNAGTFDLILPFMVQPPLKYFCLDFPGHGLTTYCPDWWYDGHMEGILAVRRVAKYFGWDKFSIFGHSLGGIVGFLYAGYFPDDIHKLCALENLRPLPVPFQNNIDMMRASMNLLFEVEERMKRPRKTYDTFEKILQKFYDGRQGTISKEGCIALLKRGANKLSNNHYQFSYNQRTSIPGQEGRTPPELSMKLAKEISSQVCFIKANPGNVYDTKEENEKFLSTLRNNLGDKYEYHTVPGTHHFHLNDPHLIAPIALKFFTKK